MVDNQEIERQGFDTDQQYIAGVYAKSLIDSAEKAGRTEEVLEQLDSFVNDVLSSLPQFARSLRSPRVSAEGKADLIEKALQGKADSYLINFLKVLNSHQRLDCLAAINSNAKSIFNELRGRVQAHVTVADQIPPDLEETIRSRLSTMLGKEVLLNVQTNPEIIGGMVVKVGDTVYDSSVANQLRQVKRNVMEGTIQQVRESIETFAVDEATDS